MTTLLLLVTGIHAKYFKTLLLSTPEKKDNLIGKQELHNFKSMLLSTSARYKDRMIEKQQLRNIVALKLFNAKNKINEGRCFIHIPRTGGFSLRKMAKYSHVKLKVWHSSHKEPPMECGCFTNLRDPIQRYISEWKFYGMRKFIDGKKVFGWFPQNGTPASFYDYANDSSTHNSMTKILSGCQMFTNCIVNEATVDLILDRVKSGCLSVLETENQPVHGHRSIYKGKEEWEDLAIKVNGLDMKLYKGIIKYLHK